MLTPLSLPHERAAASDAVLPPSDPGPPRSGLGRGHDIAIAATALAVSWPLITVLALLVRLRLGRPILFVQERPGRHGRPFRLVKLRTMRDSRDAAGRLLPDAVRLTPFGRFLRASSLDELPELWNVLRGEMAIVGPRPLLVRYLPWFTEEERLRFTVRPGITGWAQVNGRANAPWNERLAMDVWYVRNRSLALDLRILRMTLVKVLWREDVEAEPDQVALDLDEERRRAV